MLKRLLLLILCTPPLAASDDWLAQPVPHPLARAYELGLGVQQVQRETWAHENGHVLLQESDGQKVQRVLSGSLDLRWQAGAHDSLEASFPLVFTEMAVWFGALTTPRLGDPSVERSQGLGDIEVGWRHDRGSWGLGLSLIGPSGLGPWDAPHPLAATGEGRWQGKLRVSAGLSGRSVSSFVSVTGFLQGGREAELSPVAPLLYDAGGVRFLPPAATGNVYLDPRWGAEGAWGLAWDWYRGDDSRHSLALSVAGRHLGPLGVGGRVIDDTAAARVWLQPELQARFGAFEALAAWQSPALLDDNLAVPYWGELHFKLSHAF